MSQMVANKLTKHVYMKMSLISFSVDNQYASQGKVGAAILVNHQGSDVCSHRVETSFLLNFM